MALPCVTKEYSRFVIFPLDALTSKVLFSQRAQRCSLVPPLSGNVDARVAEVYSEFPALELVVDGGLGYANTVRRTDGHRLR